MSQINTNNNITAWIEVDGYHLQQETKSAPLRAHIDYIILQC